MPVYITMMYRLGDRWEHSYCIGVFTDIQKARDAGIIEQKHRGNKYEPNVIPFILDDFNFNKYGKEI